MQEKDIRTSFAIIFLIIISGLLFIPFLGNVHLFDWDEINFAEIAREMVISNNYFEPQINFQVFTEKPPLFFWLQAISMNIFGINEFAARFPNAILGIITLLLLFLIGKKLKNNLFGFIWALLYAGTILPHLYFKSGIIDPWFNFFIFLTLYGLIITIQKNKESKGNYKWMIFSGIMLGLAILTKGPASVIILGITFFIYWVSTKFKSILSFPQIVLFGIATIITTGSWLFIDYLRYGDKFLIEFTIRQWELLTTPDAGHGGFLLYHFVILFFGCFPSSAFFIFGLLKKNNPDDELIEIKKWMKILFWVVILLFTFVQTKIVHYSSLSYYPITFIGAMSFYNIVQKKWVLNRLTKVLLILSGIPFIIAPFAFAYLGQNIELLTPLLSADQFATENLQAKINWSGWEFLPGLLLIIVLILFFRFVKKENRQLSVWILLSGTIVFIQLTLIFLIGRIEGYSQRANIEFWKSHAEENCYMTSFDYKTYTHYFYGKVRPQKNRNYINNNWLLNGEIDKPVYISCRVHSKEGLEKELPDALFLYNQNGFYFYKRNPKMK